MRLSKSLTGLDFFLRDVFSSIAPSYMYTVLHCSADAFLLCVRYEGSNKVTFKRLHVYALVLRFMLYDVRNSSRCGQDTTLSRSVRNVLFFYSR